VDVDAIPSPVTESVSLTIVEEQEQQILATEEMNIDMWGEKQNPSTEKKPTQQIGLGTTHPHVQLIKEYDELP
jgi:hypothetical protein